MNHNQAGSMMKQTVSVGDNGQIPLSSKRNLDAVMHSSLRGALWGGAYTSPVLCSGPWPKGVKPNPNPPIPASATEATCRCCLHPQLDHDHKCHDENNMQLVCKPNTMNNKAVCTVCCPTIMVITSARYTKGAPGADAKPVKSSRHRLHLGTGHPCL